MEKTVKGIVEELNDAIVLVERDKYKELVMSNKGYAYDSLIYRFKDYQSRAYQLEVSDYKYKHNTGEMEAREKVRDRHNRDLIRFIQILDSVIGEHS